MQKYQTITECRNPRDGGGNPRRALQFVRKVSGYRKPSKVNQAAFERAVDEIADVTQKLLSGFGMGQKTLN